ncbi:Glucokinase regulatory protein [Raoultella ornithinolytica]|nr:Glucokinase regulatory protein [Raoultella ornithinolytica]
MGVGARCVTPGPLGAPIAVLTQQAESEAAQGWRISLSRPQTGPEAVAGFGNPKAQLAQRQILTMLTTGLAIPQRQGLQQPAGRSAGHQPALDERQIAIVMTATDCSRSEAQSRAGQL